MRCLTPLSTQGSGISEEEETEDCKSLRWWMTPRKQHCPDTARAGVHTNSQRLEMHMACTNSSQTESQHGKGEVGTNFHPWPSRERKNQFYSMDWHLSVAQLIKIQRQILGFNLNVRKAKQPATGSYLYHSLKWWSLIWESFLFCVDFIG